MAESFQSDTPGVASPRQALLTSAPLHGKFSLGGSESPDHAVLSIMPIGTDQSPLGVAANGNLFWNLPTGQGMGMGLPQQIEPEFDLNTLDDGLFIFELNVTWKSQGSAAYGFLVQVGSPGAAPIPIPTPVILAAITPAPQASIPVQNPRLRIGKGVATQVAVSPDGRWMAVSTPLGIYQYHLNSLEQAWFYPLPASPSDLRFSPAGDRLAFSDGKGTIQILRPDTGQPVAGMQTERAGTLAWAPDGRRLVSAGGCQTVIVWDAANGAKLRQLRGDLCSEGYSGIHAAWSADGKTIYAALARPIAWDASTYEPRADFTGAVLEGPMDPEILAAPAGNMLILYDGMGGPALNVLDGATGQKLRSLDVSQAMASGVAWAPDGQRLAVGHGGSGSIEIWNAATGQVLKKLDGFLATPGIAWLPDGKHLAGLTCMDGSLCIVDSETGQTFKSLKDHTVAASYMTWTSNGLLSISGLGLTSWDPKTGQSIQQSQVGSAQAWVSSWPASGPQIFLYSQSNGQAQVGDGQKQVPLEASQGIYPFHDAWSPDGKRLAGPGAVWDAQTGKILVHLSALSGSRKPDTLAWSPDGRYLALGDSLYMGPVTIVNAADGSLVASMPANTNGLNPWLGQLAYSPDGKYLAACGSLMNQGSGNSNGMLLVWDVQAKKQVALLSAGMQSDRMYTLAWSPDGRRLASGGGSGQIVVYDMTTSTPLALLLGHAGYVSAMAFSPDGRQLASTSSDGTMLLWDIP